MMKEKQLLALVAVGLLAGPMAVQAQAAYDYELIDYPGAADTQVFAVNNRGDAAGNGFDLDSFPFVYSVKKGDLTDVASIPGYDGTSVLAISDSGVLAGSVDDFGSATTSGLIIEKNGGFTVFSHPDAVSLTQARGINNKGLVSGFRDSADDQFAPENGFIYDPKTGTFTDIVPSLFTIAHGINSRGDVVGSAIFFSEDAPCPTALPPGFFVTYGWLREADESVTYFQVNGEATRARGINDPGTIAGFVNDPLSGKLKGFVVTLDGTQCQSIALADDDLLEIPGGFDQTIPEGITNSGVVVGVAFDGTNNHGFVATPQ